MKSEKLTFKYKNVIVLRGIIGISLAVWLALALVLTRHFTGVWTLNIRGWLEIVSFLCVIWAATLFGGKAATFEGAVSFDAEEAVFSMRFKKYVFSYKRIKKVGYVPSGRRPTCSMHIYTDSLKSLDIVGAPVMAISGRFEDPALAFICEELERRQKPTP